MSKYIHKSHNVSVLLYHLVCPAKYRRAVFSERVDQELKGVCLEISKRYEIMFIEIGVDKDHAHFLIQSVPIYSPRQIAQIVKSITAREIFARVPRSRNICGVELSGQVDISSIPLVNTATRRQSENTSKGKGGKTNTSCCIERNSLCFELLIPRSLLRGCFIISYTR